MTLPSNRPIWFSEIRTEFGKGNTFSSYLGAGTGIPASFPMYMAADFLGKSNAPDYTPDAITWDGVTGTYFSGADNTATSGWKLISGTNTPIQLLFRVKDWIVGGTGTKTFGVTTSNNLGGTPSNSRAGNGDIYLDLVPGSQFRYWVSITGYTGTASSTVGCNFECWNMTAPWPHDNLTSSTSCFMTREGII